MNEPIIKLKHSRAIGIGLFIAIVVGIGIYICVATDQAVEEQQNRIKFTETLPENIKHLLGGPTFDDDDKSFPDMITKDVVDTVKYNFVKYMCFSDDITGAANANTSLNAIFDRRFNEKLGITQNIDAKTLDGLVFVKLNMLKVGEYVTKGREGNVQSPALKSYYTLTFVKLPEEIVVHRDTIWGEEPAETISERGDFVGKEPPMDEIIGVLKKSLKN